MELQPQTTGTVIAVRGAVIDVAFPIAELPKLGEALSVDWDQPETLIVEVQAHLDEATVRGVALQATAGLKRGVAVRSTGGPIRVPVGDAVLGRLLDVTGCIRDNGPPLPDNLARMPIHALAPPNIAALPPCGRGARRSMTLMPVSKIAVAGLRSRSGGARA